VKKYIPIFVLTFLVYVFVGGTFTLFDVVLGIIIGSLVSGIVTPFIVSDEKKALDLKRLFYLLIYTIYYLSVAEFKAHAQVIRTIIFGKPDLKPAIVKVNYRSNNQYAVVSEANSITNTPGTVVIDLNEGKKVFYVHWLYADKLEEEYCYKNILEPFEKRLRKVFD
jgi:multicomponent Na+:H+ antiporter subunit E